MAKRAKMQRVVMSILATMFVASLVLAVVSFVWPAPVSAEYWEACSWDCSAGSWCEPGHMWCGGKEWTIYQGHGYYCTSILCWKECLYRPNWCPA